MLYTVTSTIFGVISGIPMVSVYYPALSLPTARDITQSNPTLPNHNLPTPCGPRYSFRTYHTISYLPLLGPTLVISVIPTVISVISHTPTRPYPTQRPLTQPIPTLTYPTISYLPLLDPTMVISVIPMVISVAISVFPATCFDLRQQTTDLGRLRQMETKSVWVRLYTEQACCGSPTPHSGSSSRLVISVLFGNSY